MATGRGAYPGTQAAGDVLTSANFTRLPGGWIGYSVVTANQTGITAITDLTGLSVSVTVNTNRLIRVSGIARVTQSPADGWTDLRIREGTTTLAYSIVYGNADITQNVWTLLATTAGTHTYKLSLEKLSGTGTASLDAAADHPAWILVEDLGSAS